MINFQKVLESFKIVSKMKFSKFFVLFIVCFLILASTIDQTDAADDYINQVKNVAKKMGDQLTKAKDTVSSK